MSPRTDRRGRPVGRAVLYMAAYLAGTVAVLAAATVIVMALVNQ